MNAIGLIELSSIAAGFETSDAMIKTASVKLIECLPICPGKFMVLVAGDVADIQSSVETGRVVAGANMIDSLIIPNIHKQVFPAINSVNRIERIDALGIVETFTIASGIIAADAAVKAAAVDLIEVRLSRGQGGKVYFTLTGGVSAVEAAVKAGTEAVCQSGSLVKSVVIPSPHSDLYQYLY